jgi:hypothetical protein
MHGSIFPIHPHRILRWQQYTLMFQSVLKELSAGITRSTFAEKRVLEIIIIIISACPELFHGVHNSVKL